MSSSKKNNSKKKVDEEYESEEEKKDSNKGTNSDEEEDEENQRWWQEWEWVSQLEDTDLIAGMVWNQEIIPADIVEKVMQYFKVCKDAVSL